jgi:hypothetical protein
MKRRLRDYLKAAFNARPIGMLIPPNWIGVAGFALLGLVNPGFWLLGAGLELGYLLTLATNRRFQRVVDGRALSKERRQWLTRQRGLVYQLARSDRERYLALEKRCRGIIKQQRSSGAGQELLTQGEGLGRLLWIYLRLLVTRQSLQRLLEESEGIDGSGASLEERLAELQRQLEDPGLGGNLRRSLSGQVDILEQRLVKQTEAREKMAFLEAELTRIQEQVELIREQAVVSADPQTLSQRIDQVAATLGGTSQWISQQRQIMGEVEDLLIEPPPVLLPEAVEESA